MKVLYIESRKKSEPIDLDYSKLPKRIFLVYSVQFKDLAQKIKKQFGKRVIGFKQVLGCSKLKSKYPILLIGSGRFHAINLALNGNEVYILEGNKFEKLEKKEIDIIKKKRQAALSRFLFSDKIGILVSLKPGQENFKKALRLKKRLSDKGKTAFIFLADNIYLEELENYNIGGWLNTSCPSLSYDSRIMNMHELTTF